MAPTSGACASSAPGTSSTLRPLYDSCSDAVARTAPRSAMLPRHAYVHVPFCTRRCAYCDFSIAVRRVVPVHEYLEALRAELKLRFADRAARDDWTLDTLYLGGGTPSRLGPEGVAAALDAVRAHAALADDAEVTIEANPE